MEGAYTFSNFVVEGNTVPVPVSNFTVSLGPSTSATGLILSFGYTDLDNSGDDFLLNFTITPGVGTATLTASVAISATEMICSAEVSGSCGGTLLNKSTLSVLSGNTASSAVTLAGEDFVFKDITGGSLVTETFTPEPVTFSLMGLGLMALGFAGRKRLRKD